MDQYHAAMTSLLFRQDAARYRKLACGTVSRTIAQRLRVIAEECERDAALLAERPAEFSGSLVAIAVATAGS